MHKIGKLLCLFVFLFAAFNSRAQKIQFKKKWTARSVLSQPKGFRPKPEIYLTPKYIKKVLKKYKNGGSFITSADIINKNPGEFPGWSGGQFIYTTRQMDEIMEIAGGNKTRLERELHLKPGTLTKKIMYRVDVPHPRAYNLRLPSGNEPAANESWEPGGQLSNGRLQAVIDQVPAGEFTVTKIE